MRASVAVVLVILVVAGCSSTPSSTPSAPTPPSTRPDPAAWPRPPAVPDGPLAPRVAEAAGRLTATRAGEARPVSELQAVANSGDARLGWLVADLLRLAVVPSDEAALVDAFERLTGANPRESRYGANPWLAVTNLLIGWDLPAPPEYSEWKASLLLALEPGWAPFFADAESTIDWRVTTWGGVFIDDRPAGSTDPCERACIPALDDPLLVSAADGSWYADDRIVFGISLGGDAVALPQHIMEVHEMVNLTLGGRRIGIPYCTLCASAQAYLTDEVPAGSGPLVLRTSGLLSRSNKLMFDLESGSAIHTFTGRAASGPLRELDVTLQQVTVTVSTWGEWKAAHPETRIVAEDGGIGRVYPDDPLCGRDDAGPIFPIGPADTRLPVQAAILGVVDPSDGPIAFAAEAARAQLQAGRPVAHAGVELTLHDGTLRARRTGGAELVSHHAFWFAWSQFHPGTALWAPVTAMDHAAEQPLPDAGGRVADDCSRLLDSRVPPGRSQTP